MKIIGLGHYSRTGKDTIANALIASLAAQAPTLKAAKKPFAWKLKQICFELYAWDGMREPELYETKEGEPLRDLPLPTIGKTPVQIWIDMGTPAVREKVYIDTWIDYLLNTDHGVDVLVVPDVRFENEVAAIRKLGGKIIKVVRPGYGPRKSVADRALLGFYGWDFVAGGSGQMSELQQWGSMLSTWITAGISPVQTEKDRDAALAVEVVEPWSPPASPVNALAIDAAIAKQILDLNSMAILRNIPGLAAEVVEKLAPLALTAL